MRVAGIDTSTQSVKIVVMEAETGEVVRQASRPHPKGTTCPPTAWWDAFELALQDVGGLDDVAALGVGGQQHGMVLLDADGNPLLDAPLWNDTASAQAAADLTAELGPAAWAEATGLVAVASFTATKLRWVADNRPELVDRIAAVCLPHDYLTWRILGTGDLQDLVTDRSDASGTMYVDPVRNEYRRDLFARALRRSEEDVAGIVLPRILGPSEQAGYARGIGLPRTIVSAGAGDNASAGLGMGVQPGEVWVSLGTSGVVTGISEEPWRDETGLIAGFADGTGHFLPLQATLNGAPVLDATAAFLGVDHVGLSELALAAEPGAGGLTLLPLFAGERTPNLPDAMGSLHGITGANLTRENMARAAVEGLLCLMGACIERLGAKMDVSRVYLTGGGSKSLAVRQIAPAVLGRDVVMLEDGEHVAWGAARQAQWALTGELPSWSARETEVLRAEPMPHIQQRWDALLKLTQGR